MLVSKAFHEVRIIGHRNPVVDPVGFTDLECFAYVVGGPLLASMDRRAHTQPAAVREVPLEFGRRVAPLGAAETEPQESTMPGLSQVDEFHCGAFGSVPLGGHDDRGVDVQLGSCTFDRLEDPVELFVDGDFGVQEGLRPEEHLGARDSVCAGTTQVGIGQVMEVATPPKHTRAEEQQFQEVFETVEFVFLLEFFDR